MAPTTGPEDRDPAPAQDRSRLRKRYPLTSTSGRLWRCLSPFSDGWRPAAHRLKTATVGNEARLERAQVTTKMVYEHPAQFHLTSSVSASGSTSDVCRVRQKSPSNVSSAAPGTWPPHPRRCLRRLAIRTSHIRQEC